MTDLISLNDLSTEEIYELLDLAARLKKDVKEGKEASFFEKGGRLV